MKKPRLESDGTDTKEPSGKDETPDKENPRNNETFSDATWEENDVEIAGIHREPRKEETKKEHPNSDEPIPNLTGENRGETTEKAARIDGSPKNPEERKETKKEYPCNEKPVTELTRGDSGEAMQVTDHIGDSPKNPG